MALTTAGGIGRVGSGSRDQANTGGCCKQQHIAVAIGSRGNGVLDTAFDRIGELFVGPGFTIGQAIKRCIQRAFIAVFQKGLNLNLETALPKVVFGTASRLGKPLGQFHQKVGFP